MASEAVENEGAEAEAEAGGKLPIKPGVLIVIVLSVLVGILLTVVAVGAYVYQQRAETLRGELQAARNDLKGKSAALDDMQAQIEALSKQMRSLREYSMTHANTPPPEPSSTLRDLGSFAPAPAGKEAERAAAEKAAAEKAAAKVPAPAPAAAGKAGAPSPAGKPPVADSKAAPAPEPVLPKINKLPAERASCDITGKSPEEQAAILKRCVSAMDGGGGGAKSR